ncbi:MAG: hypothetical protein A3H96_00225 [Acidobacteria bacterium RIFCSPLOWO2_02_FULL_67_36]|nr:MAG: hypothetical protein A3H96_00225 [Acidobacteria bacterium RIFCSPLOWO2_02_FULL_67_36]OFW19615.1 MAG: hypothetical protein A3G21_21665 [Acidobacteria bacterium RIFCSPLOWO2_12_FULL_66_21]
MQIPAAERLARVMWRAIQSEGDPTTIGSWSHAAASSSGALRAWCRAAGIRPKAALDFARLCRAIALARDTGLHPEDFLDVVDRRTLHGLLKRGGLDPAATAQDVQAFLKCQRLIQSGPMLHAIAGTLHELGAFPSISGEGPRNLRHS